jgi:hypothetical protein
VKININPNVRNVAIIILIATLVVVVPGGGSGSQFVIQLISIIFLASIAWVASRLYREHRVALYSLGDQRRAVVYTAAGVATLAFSATGRLWNSPGGSILWLALLAGAAFAIFQVFRTARDY